MYQKWATAWFLGQTLLTIKTEGRFSTTINNHGEDQKPINSNKHGADT